MPAAHNARRKTRGPAAACSLTAHDNCCTSAEDHPPPATQPVVLFRQHSTRFPSLFPTGNSQPGSWVPSGVLGSTTPLADGPKMSIDVRRRVSSTSLFLPHSASLSLALQPASLARVKRVSAACKHGRVSESRLLETCRMQIAAADPAQSKPLPEARDLQMRVGLPSLRKLWDAAQGRLLHGPMLGHP